MKRIITASLVATMALTSAHADRITDIEGELAKLKKQVKKQNTKINEVKAHDSGDNIKWGADMRTSYDYINYDMADGSSAGNDALYSMRLWLNMAYAPDANNVFKGQLSMNKAFGADFASPVNRTFSLGGQFDWTSNEALTDNSLKVRQAYWLYLGEKAFGADIPWTFSIGRRPSTNGFLSSLSQDDPAASPLGHMINVEYDGLSSKLDLSKVTGVPGMSVKLCMGQGSTNAQPLFETATPYASGDASNVDQVSLAGFIVEPYNDGQYITKLMVYRAWNVPGQDVAPTFAIDPVTSIPTNVFMTGSAFDNKGDMDGAVFSAMIDGITEEGYFADAKVFGSFGWSKSNPAEGKMMMGSADSETGTSYYLGAYLPVTVEDDNYGTVGLEFNHGSEFWRPFTYAEDTLAGSKMATRGDAYEANWTYKLTDALSMQLRYVRMDYDYTGSNGFFGNYSGNTMKIDDMKDAAAAWNQLSGGGNPTDLATIGNVATALGGDMNTAMQLAGAAQFLPNVVETAEDFRFYIRYRF